MLNSQRALRVRPQSVLSLAKLAGVDQRYYLEQAERRVDHAESVSTGAEDYYLAGPEAAGEWTGSAARILALQGEVTEASLRSMLTAHDPRTGIALEGSVQQARVPGFDLMFSVPKSASILFGIGDDRIQRAVLDAQSEAVQAALEYLEKRACRTRRGRGGYEIIEGEGFVGAAFRHRTSRAGDPQIHTHVLVANATRIGDDNWGSLDGRAIYSEARTAGFIHEAVFRRGLRERLGVKWSKARNGIGEIEGVPAEAIAAFSQRKAEIDAQISEWGTDTAAARQAAAMKTRRAKDYNVTPERLAPEWRQRARGFGLDRERVRTIVGRSHAEEAMPTLPEQFLSPDGLTSQRSSFDRRDAIRAVAESATNGMTLQEIESVVDELVMNREVVSLEGVQSDEVIRLRDGRVVPAHIAAQRYSTRELLDIEQEVVDRAVQSASAGAGVASEVAVEAALVERPSIGDDQAAMVRRLCLEGSGVQVVVGPPGTGKTFALATAREAWEGSGLTVFGAAVARRAAVELTTSAGIEATSVAALLGDLRTGATRFDDRTVLVVDEAAMLGTRDLATLSRYTTAAGAKLVLVGDHAQLPEIDAGGSFRALVERTNAIVLETNRRQVRVEHRQLLDLWRAGELDAALTIATEAGDLVLDLTPEETYRRIVADYCRATRTGEDVVMLAPRRAEVRHLNELARHALAQQGLLGEEALEVSGRAFAAGDAIVLRRNDTRLDVQNGTRARVTRVDPGSRTLTIQLRDGTTRCLSWSYVAARSPNGVGAVEHGYALTAHIAQGMTVDRAFVLGSETVYREWGYVAFSRARLGTRFYVVEPAVSDEHHTAATPPEDQLAEAARRLGRSERQELAMEALPALAAKHNRVDHLERALGARPHSIRGRRRWDRAARGVERYRARHAIDDPRMALGARPQNLRDALAWDKADRELRRHQRGLGLHRSRGRGLDRA